MSQDPATANESLRAENAELRARLQKAEEKSGVRLRAEQIPDAEEFRLHRDMLAQVSEAVIAIDPEERITFFNAAAERQYGVAAADALGRRLREVFEYRWLRPEDEAAARSALAEHGAWRGENLHITRDGREVFVSSVVRTRRGPDGAINGMVAVIRDVSEKRKWEALADSAHLRIESIINNTPALVYAFDLENRILLVNTAVAKLWKIPPSQMIGLRRHEFMPKQDADWHEANDQKVLASGVAIEFEETSQLPDHTIFWLTTKFPLRDANGQIYGIAGISTDVSERKQVEAALRKSDTRLRLATEAAGLGVWEWRPARDEVHWENDWLHRILGIDAAEAPVNAARFVSEFLVAADRERFEETLGTVVREHGAFRFEGKIHRRDGEVRWIEFTGMSVSGAMPEDLRVLGTMQDITLHKLAEATTGQNAALFADLVEQAPMGVYVVDAQFRMQQINREALPVFKTVSPLIGRDFAEVMNILWGPEVGQKRADIFRHTLATGERYVSPPFTEQRFDLGLVQTFEWQTQRVTLPSGEYGVVCYFHEITERERAAQAVRAGEQRMRLATETTGVGIWEWHVPSGKVRWDAQMFRIYGAEPTSDGLVEYATWRNLVAPEDLARQEEILRETVANCGHSAREFRIRRASDDVCCVIQAVETVRTNERGETEWVVGTNLDITERRRANEALRTSEARLALGVHVAGLALAEIDYATGQNHLSAEAARLFGLGDAAMVLPRDAVHATFHPDDRAELAHGIAESLDPAGSGCFEMDHRVVWPNGEVRWLRVRKQVFFTGEGDARRPARATLAALDVTAEKRGAEAVRASEEFVRGVLDSLPEHVVVLDDHGVVRSVNEPWKRFARENGAAAPAVAVGVNYLDACCAAALAGDHHALETLKGLKAVLSGRENYFALEYPCHAPGRERWFLMQAQRTSHGPPGVILSHVDITERKRAENSLRDVAKRKDEFLAMLGHELRNPLNAIRHAVQISTETPEDHEACEWAAKVIDRQSQQLSRMVDDLLDVARISRGRIELRVETLELGSVLERAIAVQRPLFTKRRHTFRSEIASDLRVTGDTARLEQIFVNLLNNAAKYTPDGGSISLRACVDDGEAVVTITDNGQGIPADLLPHVFDLFRQADSSLDRAFGGLGIGLSVVKSLVEMHMGRVVVESAGANAGTTVTVRFPRVLEEESNSAPIATSAPATASPKPARVLVVDDHEDAAHALARLLRLRGCEVRLAHTGRDGIAAARNFRPEAILLDLGLPELDGYEVIRILRSEAPLADALVIAISGYAQNGDRQRCLGAGFDDHFPKPLDFPKLMDAIRARCAV